MRTTTIFASATSTMHADLIVVGLKRLGIPTAAISVIYPGYSQPDSVLYWMDGSSRLPLTPTGEMVTVSGGLRFALENACLEDDFPFLVQRLRSLGLTDEQSQSFEAALRDDHVVVAINAGDDSELALVVHILHHIAAEKIVIAETPLTPAGIHGKAEKAGLTLSAA